VAPIKVPLADVGAEAPELSPAGAVVLQPAGVAHNLPVQLTSFVGREAEMAQVCALLTENRLLTLTGAGGVGKTRLALEVAATVLPKFPAGAWLADMAPLTGPALVPVAVARALGLPDQQGVATMAIVTSFIGPRLALLVLDNCEHLLDACAALAEDLLRACPGLTILATSREPLGAAGEAVWRVPSLALAGEAVELFADRAARARPGFAMTPVNAAAVENLPDLAAALRSQLGLRLESRRASVEMLVIDHVEKMPTEN